ncbi:MAG: L,D-transpeptidase family protein [Planctomycetota bacterium]
MKTTDNRRTSRLISLLVILCSSLIVAGLFRLTPRTGIGRAENDALLGTPLPNPSIVINKEERRLYLYSSSQIVRSYPIGLGSQPVGDKLRHGDGRTPEGQYYICVKNPNSRYYLSLGLSYPNVEDAHRGLRAGLISGEQYQKIAQATTDTETPPWDTPLGGEIFIHGRASAGDWIRGCIALADRDIQELYDAVAVGTPVLIQPGRTTASSP